MKINNDTKDAILFISQILLFFILTIACLIFAFTGNDAEAGGCASGMIVLGAFMFFKPERPL